MAKISIAKRKPAKNEDNDEADLQHCEIILDPRPRINSPHMNGGKEDDHKYRKRPRGNKRIVIQKRPLKERRKCTVEVFAEADGRGCDRRRESHHERCPTAEKSEERVIEIGQKDVFSARLRERSTKTAVGDRSAESNESTCDPEDNHQDRVDEIRYKQSACREDSRPDHVGDDDVRQGEKAELSLKVGRHYVEWLVLEKHYTEITPACRN